MAESLAKSLGVKVKWVKTSWKTLTPDFVAGKCDIAMGGISVTLERQKHVFFANKLDSDGKIPLVRCTDVKKYRYIGQINRPSVRMLEPADGINEAFVHAYLSKAKLTLTNDNLGIFQQLVDRMITDASETLYHQKRYPKLCAVNAINTMQYGEKAYMLPRDNLSWKFYADQWLHLARQAASIRGLSINGWRLRCNPAMSEAGAGWPLRRVSHRCIPSLRAASA